AAPAVVGHQDAVHAVLYGKLGILCGKDALEHDLHPGDVAHALDRLPRKIAGLAAAGNAGQVDAVVIVPARRAFGEARAVVADRAFAAILAHETQKRLLVATGDAINSNREHRTAGRFGAFDQRLGDFPLRR